MTAISRRAGGSAIATTFVLEAALAAVAGVLVSLYCGVVDFFVGFVAASGDFTAAVLEESARSKAHFWAGSCLRSRGGFGRPICRLRLLQDVTQPSRF